MELAYAVAAFWWFRDRVMRIVKVPRNDPFRAALQEGRSTLYFTLSAVN